MVDHDRVLPSPTWPIISRRSCGLCQGRRSRRQISRYIWILARPDLEWHLHIWRFSGIYWGKSKLFSAPGPGNGAPIGVDGEGVEFGTGIWLEMVSILLRSYSL